MTTDLEFVQDGIGQRLNQFLREQGERLYPGVGYQTWRVPPIHFNKQTFLDKAELRTVSMAGIRVQKPSQESSQQNIRAEGLVSSSFELLSNRLTTQSQPAIFIISNFDYDNYLNKISQDLQECMARHTEVAGVDVTPVGGAVPESVPQAIPAFAKRPRDVTQRGELDILLLHQEAGLVLVQNKAVGYCFPQDGYPNARYLQYIKRAIEKAGKQLLRDRAVMLHVMGDLELNDDQITSVIAMPNLSRRVLHWALVNCPQLKSELTDTFHLDPDHNILCAEEFKQSTHGCCKALEQWWKGWLIPQVDGLKLEVMKDIAFRTVGLLSTVSVWSFAQPRMEVRSLNDAAFETGNRYAHVILSPRQAELLQREQKYFYLWGPAGSGKTLLLSLKGRQWLHKQVPVAILNTRLGSKGRTVGQVMESTINNSESLKSIESRAQRIDLDLMEDKTLLLKSIVSKFQPGEQVNFLLDEVTWERETEKLLAVLMSNFPDSSIWCAGMLERCKPTDFESDSLVDILRCPPSVQRVLQVVDNRQERKELYHLDSVSAELPTDGPRPYIIIHSQHKAKSGVDQPYDCEICGKLLANFLLNKLNLQSSRRSLDLADEISSPISKDSHRTDTHRGDSPSVLEKDTPHPESARTVSLSCQSKPGLKDPHLWGSSKGSDSGCGSETLDCDRDDVSCQNCPEDGAWSLSSTLCNATTSELDFTRSTNVCDMDTANIAVKQADVAVAMTDQADFATAPKEKAGAAAVRLERKCLLSDDNSSPLSDHTDPPKSSRSRNRRNRRNTETTSSEVEKSKTETKQATSSLSDQATISQNTENGGLHDNEVACPCKKEIRTSCGKSGRRPHKKQAKQARRTQNEPCGHSATAGGKKGKGSHVGAPGSLHVSGPRLRFSDAVMPVTVPIGWHHMGVRGYWAISKTALAQDMLLLGSGALCQELCKQGIPLQVEEAMVLNSESKKEQNREVKKERKNKIRRDLNSLAKGGHNYMVLCPLGAVHGLEYKVVVCIPSARTLPEFTDIYETIENGKGGTMQRMKRTKWGTDYMAQVQREETAGETERAILREIEADIDKARISTHVSSDENDSVDVLYEPWESEEVCKNDQTHETLALCNEEDETFVEQFPIHKLSLNKRDECADLISDSLCQCGSSPAQNAALLFRSPCALNTKTVETSSRDTNDHEKEQDYGANVSQPGKCEEIPENLIVSGNLSGCPTYRVYQDPWERNSELVLSHTPPSCQCKYSDRQHTEQRGCIIVESDKCSRIPERSLSESQDGAQISGTQAEIYSDMKQSTYSSVFSPKTESDSDWHQSTSSSVYSPISETSSPRTSSLLPSHQPSTYDLSSVSESSTLSIPTSLSSNPSSISSVASSPCPSAWLSSTAEDLTRSNIDSASSDIGEVWDNSVEEDPLAGRITETQACSDCNENDCICCIEKIRAEVCGQCDTNQCVCRHFQPHELKALHKLTVWNKAYILICASRCTSQLVLVLP